MKERQKTVYYCDFCKKHKFTKPSMIRHELSCTLNPDRVCRVRGCEGDCPWCEFSKKRLAGEYIEAAVTEQMETWWAKKGNQYVMRTYDEAIY